jgi:hypothetical protein
VQIHPFREQLNIALRRVEVAPRGQWFAQLHKEITELRKAASSKVEWATAQDAALAVFNKRNRTADYSIGQLEKIVSLAEQSPLRSNGHAPHASAGPNGNNFASPTVATETRPSAPTQPEQEMLSPPEQSPSAANGAGGTPAEPEPSAATKLLTIEDIDPRELPIDDPDAARIVQDAVKPMKYGSVDKLKAISEARRQLDPVTQGDAIDYLSDVAIYNLGLDPDAVQLALAHGA